MKNSQASLMQVVNFFIYNSTMEHPAQRAIAEL